VRTGFARFDAGEIDAFDLDDLIHHYKRSARELWKFCGSSGSDWERAASALAYWQDQGDEPDCMGRVSAKLADLAPDDADPADVAREIVRVVELPMGQRPFRVHIDPAQDGAEAVNELGDQVRRRFYGATRGRRG